MVTVTQNKGVRRGRLRRPVVASCIVGLVVVIAVALWVCRGPDLYTVRILPLCGGRPFEPYAMNDNGQVVGLVPTAGSGRDIVLWDREHGMRELRIAFNGPVSINDRGQIAGTTTDPNGLERAFLWDPETGLTQYGGPFSRAMAINNRGQVVGSCSSCACIWEGPSFGRNFSLLRASGQGVAHRINDSGQILGGLVESGKSQPCLWDLADPECSACIPLPSDDASFRGLNNGGYALGEMLCPAEGSNRSPQRYAVLWHEDRDTTWLFPLAGLDSHVAYLNDANQVVYQETHRSILTKSFPRWFPPRSRFFLWDPKRGKVPIDKRLRLGRTDQFFVSDLNNRGCIVGIVSSTRSVQEKRAVLLEPIARRWRR